MINLRKIKRLIFYKVTFTIGIEKKPISNNGMDIVEAVSNIKWRED